MKKYLAMLCAAMLFACCLGLAACGGSSSSSAAASGSASADASASASASASAEASSSAAAQATFAGEWKMAGLETQGLTMVGDLSSVMDSEMVLTLKDDGTGTMTLGENSANLTWAQNDATTATLTVEATEGSQSNTVDVTLADGALRMAMDTEDMSGDVIFTSDGKYAGAAEIDVAGATAITDEKALVGTWTLSGLKMMGISMYGDPAALASMAGDTDVTVTFEEGGKVTLMGQEVTYTTSADGTTITEDGISLAIKALDGNLILDMSEALGMEMVMVFSK